MEKLTEVQIAEKLKALPHWTFADGYLMSTFNLMTLKNVSLPCLELLLSASLMATIQTGAIVTIDCSLN